MTTTSRRSVVTVSGVVSEPDRRQPTVNFDALLLQIDVGDDYGSDNFDSNTPRARSAGMADDDDDDDGYNPPAQPNNSRGMNNSNFPNRMPNAPQTATSGPPGVFKAGMNPQTGNPINKPQPSMWQGQNPAAPAAGLRPGGGPQTFQRTPPTGNVRPTKNSRDPRGKMDPNQAGSMQYVQYEGGRRPQSQYEHGIEAGHGYGPTLGPGYDGAFADLSPMLPSHVS